MSKFYHFASCLTSFHITLHDGLQLYKCVSVFDKFKGNRLLPAEIFAAQCGSMGFLKAHLKLRLVPGALGTDTCTEK